jgi:hypothetical protein
MEGAADEADSGEVVGFVVEGETAEEEGEVALCEDVAEALATEAASLPLVSLMVLSRCKRRPGAPPAMAGAESLPPLASSTESAG